MSDGIKHRDGAPAVPTAPTSRLGLFGVACLCALGLAALFGGGAASALATAPAVTIEPASEVAYSSAKATGEVDPADHETNYHFEYAIQAQFEASKWAEAAQAGFGSLSEGAGPIPVEAELTGLAPGTVYHLRLFASNSEGEEVEAVAASTFETEAVNPPGASGLAISPVTSESAHFAGTVNSGGTGPGEKAGAWQFTCSPECPGIEDQHEFEAEGIGDGSDHTVDADATGLQPNTEYTVTLRTQNAGGEGNASEPFTTEAVAPDLEPFTTTGPVADTTARLVAIVNPHNAQITACHFDYGPTAAYGQSVPCDSDPGAGNAPRFVGADLSGLQSATTYHYRLVVQGDGGTTLGSDQTVTTTAVLLPQSTCPNQAIRAQQDSTYLPDCRAYEMVSPVDKNGLEVNAAMDISPDGNRALFGMFGGAPQSTSGAQSWLRATRTSKGWVSENVLPPASEQPDENYQLIAATPDQLDTLWAVATGLGQQGLTPRLTIARITDGSQSLLQQFPTYFGNSGSEFVGVDRFSHVFGSVPVALDASHQPGTVNVYDFGTGTPELVSVMPATGQAPVCGVENDRGFARSGGQARVAQHWISSDGSHVFFLSVGDNCSDPLELYVRDRNTDTTTLVSGPVASGADQGVDLFLQAASDGSWVIYRTATALDVADTDTTPDIYRYSALSGNVCLTCVATGPANVSLDLGGDPVLAASVSEDGSHVYFVSQDQIDGEGIPGDHNIYLWHAGTIKYIAPSDGVGQVLSAGSQSTPDGEVLIFRSSQPGLNALTGSDNGGYLQLYRYADRTEQLTCVSCPSAAAATADVPALVRSPLTIIESRNAVSEDGSIVAFSTSDALVTADVNQTRDVYEWHDGDLSLLTRGTMTYDGEETHSDLVSVSPSGRDILIEDFDKLTSDPQDDATKLFDARVEGGFPSSPPLSPCEGEACLASPAGSAAVIGGGSDAFTGPRNARHHRTKKHHRHRRHHKRTNKTRRASR